MHQSRELSGSTKRKSDPQLNHESITMSSKRHKPEGNSAGAGVGRTKTANPSSTTAAAYFIATSHSPSTYYSSSLSINTLSNSHLNHDHHHQQGRRPESKETLAVTMHHQPHQQMRRVVHPHPPLSQLQSPEQDKFFSRNRCIATTLVITYLIEVTVQIFLIIQCCRSLKRVDIASSSAASSSSSSEWTWFWFLVFSSLLSSFLVTLVSIVWVFRGMDFSNRVCGRLLCYVMHSFLLGLLWRYLKLAFAYDKTDLEEFFKLKMIHSYIQSLPLVTIHLAWVLSMQQQMEESFSYQILSLLVVVELLTGVISLLILPNLNNWPRASPSKTVSDFRARCDDDASANDKQFDLVDSSYNRGQPENMRSLSAVKIPFYYYVPLLMSHKIQNWSGGRAFLLAARLISIGMLLHKLSYYWTAFITLLHFALSSLWIFPFVCSKLTKVDGSHPDSCKNVQRAADECCDNLSSDSSNDSGLVVKSEIPVAISSQDDNEDGRSSVKPRGHHPVYPNCLSIVIHRRSRNIIPDDDYANIANSNNDSGLNAHYLWTVISRVLPLSYILCWDVGSSPAATCFAASDSDNNLNLWATALPVLLSAVETVAVAIYHWNSDMMALSATSAACLCLGWLITATFQWRYEKREAESQSGKGSEEGNLNQRSRPAPAGQVKTGDEDEESDEGINCVELSDNEGNIVNRKGTGECLSLCCSSLSHPLNIKRKAQEEGNFCKNLNNQDVSSVAFTVSKTNYNEYENQEQLGGGRQFDSPPRRANGKAGDKSDMTNECKKDSMRRACATASPPNNANTNRARSVSTTPVTNNNYTNIKEALTRRISSQSCRGSLTESHYHTHQQQHHHQLIPERRTKNCMNQVENLASEKGDVSKESGVQREEGERMMISSSGLASTSSALAPQHQHYHHQSSLPNSQKCIPISIKSPISWLPLPDNIQCCNESSGTSSSSNSRNTNTFDPSSSSNSNNNGKLFCCPEKCTDLENDVMKRSAIELKRGASRTPDFSVVFFEEGAGRKGKSPVAQSAPSYVSARQRNQHDPIEEEEGRRGSAIAAAQLRNQITGKTYLSDGASLASWDGLCEIRASTPVEIKKASRVIVNYPPPHHKLTNSKTVSRCLCSDGKVESEKRNCVGGNSIYEKLMDDSYGILICEGENNNAQCQRKNCSCECAIVRLECERAGGNDHPKLSSSFRNSKPAKLTILCKKCLGNHDPLLTNCTEHIGNGRVVQGHSFPQVVSSHPNNTTPAPVDSDSTDYPSDTELTTINNPLENDDGQSLSTHFSSATYTWHQTNQSHPSTQLSQFIWAASSITANNRASSADYPKEFTSSEYVRTWLMASHPRIFSAASRTHQQRPQLKGEGSMSPSKNNYPKQNKSTCDKPISKKKKKFRQLEKRQRPVGRGASPPPPAKESVPPTVANFNSCLYANIATATETPKATVVKTCAADGGFKPPPSRKLHPSLFYDAAGSRQEEQNKPLAATPHKKCRDQLDLFHKELETVV